MEKQGDKSRISDELKRLIQRANGALATSNKQQVTAYLYVIFSLFALSFFGLFAIGPTLTTISNLNKQYEEDLVALQQLEAKNAALKSLSEQYVDIQPDLPLIENAIPQTPRIAELTRQLEILFTSNNLIVQKLDTGLMELYPAKNTTSPIFSYSFSLAVMGSESDINSFILSFINMGRIISVDKLTTGKGQGDLFSASITGKAFFYKE